MNVVGAHAVRWSIGAILTVVGCAAPAVTKVPVSSPRPAVCIRVLGFPRHVVRVAQVCHPHHISLVAPTSAP
jgi:hypothetical protein